MYVSTPNCSIEIVNMVSCFVLATKRKTRAVVRQRYIELLVVVDHTTLKWHVGQDVESYILTLINLVCTTILSDVRS